MDKFYLDKSEGRYSLIVDPILEELSYSTKAKKFLDDIESVIKTGKGFNAVEGVKDNNRYVVIDTRGDCIAFANLMSAILKLEKQGRGIEGMYYSVPDSLDIDSFYDSISYSSVVDYLLTSPKGFLEDQGIEVELLRNITPCPLCGKTGNIYKEKYSGVNLKLSVMKNSYGDVHNMLRVGKEQPVLIEYCPKCGRRLESEW